MGYREERSVLQGKVENLEERLERATEIEREMATMRRRMDELGTELSSLRSEGGATPQRRARSRRSRSAVAGLALVLGAAGVAAVLAATRSLPPVLEPALTRPASTDPPLAVRPRSFIFVGHSFCFVAGETADTPDVAALARLHPFEDFRAVVFDGRTGRQRWASERTWGETGSSRGDVRCPAPDRVFAWGTNRTMELHDARTGVILWQAHPEETPNEVGFGPGCVSVGLIDKTTFDTDLATGARRACVPSSPRTRQATKETKETAVTLPLARSSVTLTAKPVGTPTLVVRSVGERTWERKLDVAALGDFSKLWMQAHDDVVVLVGADPVDGNMLTLVGLDAETGAIRYQNPLGKANNGWLPFFRVEGRYLFTFLDGLQAFDPATGEHVWQASVSDGP